MTDNWRTCRECRLASRRERGAKCMVHGSTGTTVRLAPRERERLGELGPFRPALCGYDPIRAGFGFS